MFVFVKSTTASMLEIEPKELVFREVRLNQSYTSSLCLTNGQAISIDISIRPSSSRYHVSPSRVHLNPGQSIVITVRLHITHFPNYALGVRGQTDSIQISSTFFEQKVDVHFFLSPKKNSARPRSLSPFKRDTEGKTISAGTPPQGELSDLSQYEEKSRLVSARVCELYRT